MSEATRREIIGQRLDKIIKGFSTRFVLAYTLLIGILSIMHILLFRSVSTLSAPIVYFGLGLLCGFLGAAYGFYFTTSKDASDRSKVDQTKDLADLAKNNPFNEVQP